MSEELKPVRCGCGGEAKIVDYLSRENCQNAYYVYCKVCGMQTAEFFSEAEAVEAWNKAMSAETIEFLSEYAWGLQTDPGPECAAPWNPDRNRYCCEICGHYVGKYDHYCGGCGARLTDYVPEGRGKKK